MKLFIAYVMAGGGFGNSFIQVNETEITQEVIERLESLLEKRNNNAKIVIINIQRIGG